MYLVKNKYIFKILTVSPSNFILEIYIKQPEMHTWLYLQGYLFIILKIKKNQNM